MGGSNEKRCNMGVLNEKRCKNIQRRKILITYVWFHQIMDKLPYHG
jgi:hypothetical protein